MESEQVLNATALILILICVYLIYKCCSRNSSSEHMIADRGEALATDSEVDSPCQVGKIDPFMPRVTEDIIPGSIFVSIASYRDDECSTTIKDLFDKASDPSRVFVGAVQQNKESAESCIAKCDKCKERIESGHIRVAEFKHTDARGPTFARFEATKLWKNEQYFFQIDSHTQFEKDWDQTIRKQFELTNDPKAVIGGYPFTFDQMKKNRGNHKQTIHMCYGELNEDKLPGLKGKVVNIPKDGKPIPEMYIGAGNMVLPYQALVDVPYDPYLAFLFFGEEILYSARLWTSGYNMYAPTQQYIAHHYERKDKPKFWNDRNKDFAACKPLAIKRAKAILDLIPETEVPKGFRANMRHYAMGTERPLKEYWQKAGIDFNKKDFNTC